MTQEKWTPGPWVFGYDNDIGPDDDSFEEWFTAGPARIDGCDDQSMADAYLTSAAPEMYEALAQIVFDWDGEPEDMAAARAALAKARGEA